MAKHLDFIHIFIIKMQKFTSTIWVPHTHTLLVLNHLFTKWFALK